MNVGDKVVRRHFTLKDGAKYGVIHSIIGNRADVDWQAPYRIGGDGWHRSRILLSSIMPATDEELADRKKRVRAAKDRHKSELESQQPYLCTGVHALRLRVNQVSDGACRYCGAPVVLMVQSEQSTAVEVDA